ncbi:Tyrosine recombinase XerD [Mycobacteroides franklinii]|uniref:Tyrosine recombinase XerD n=2 Tax=Mycobacteroides franklinii TaxID=948102 RepID=A0A4V3HUQ4_9MYCO|nr:Tyrosine recombinase XerD [Mycobacteroides franklinii]TDZ49203.1 Tyrosine recombinase XerD [Mycobacteroides franklinii]TDZ59383.1 Tyrosine recombinase XerD [Mycobacteroides franklinii]TDZ66898.1 Tyrosine recombinase XerD [Mycobacteroides franklinii]TDZ72822.1 Tyrosine recombinase XerD [Mycobacteroides franklinii]
MVRSVEHLQIELGGYVRPGESCVPWLVYDDAGEVVRPIAEFLRDFAARGTSPSSIRSYAYALLRWWRWLATVDVMWDRATQAEVRDLALWLQLHPKPRRLPRTASATTVGTTNQITGKQYLDDHYAARTIRHSNAVVSSFYEFWGEQGLGPLVNPVARDHRDRGRANAHHNPMHRFRAEGRIRHNPKIPRRRPRAMTDDAWGALFDAMGSNRDRALLALAISNGARASEVLGMRGIDVDWGNQQVRVIRKGTRAEQWLPASSDAFVWLRLYLSEVSVRLEDPLWVTLRKQRDVDGTMNRVPLTYEALRGVLRRANAKLGTNWTMHDLRHTCALRMAADRNVSLRDVQTILGHAHLETTAEVYLVEDERHTVERVAEHLARLAEPKPQPAPVGEGYSAGDLAVLFGKGVLS